MLIKNKPWNNWDYRRRRRAFIFLII